MTGWKKKTDEEILRFKEEPGKAPYLSFPMLEKTGILTHGFSTRLGGVSEGIYRSMNLSFSRGDRKEAVMENFRRFGSAIGVKPEDMVFSRQTHTANIRKATKADKGKGILSPADYDDVDGLVTDVPGLCLVTLYADCVPLFFADPVRKVIGLSHSGWRGTVQKIGAVTVRMMEREYGCRPENILACIGPSICQDCYEVSEDVVRKFADVFPEEVWPELFYQKADGKYQLNLWKANEQVFREAGIRPNHMAVTNICTSCNPELLYSHRASKGQRGSLAAFMALK